MVAAAVIGTGIVSAGVGLAAADKAADAQGDAASQASAIQKYMYDQTRADQAPYRQAGTSALDRLSVLLGLTKPPEARPARSESELRTALAPRYQGDPAGLDAAVKTWQQHEAGQNKDAGNYAPGDYGMLTEKFTGEDVGTDPGYQFGLKEGLDSAEGSAAARGGLYSGATLKALTQYGNDYATTKFDEAFNRDASYKDSVFNRLSGVAGTGQTATNQVGAAGQNYANQAGQNLIGAGNARGASYIAGANAIGGALNQGAAWWARQPVGGGGASFGPALDSFYGGVGGSGG